ncbi:hypothetical protein [Bifidobacterium dentium]|uniref:hypothetical protein n=1 Tax=Bifidobacterium dentium TaxID=1689 RepID=UPI001F5147D2|nr:hypothetical protein [Bifidobacterium dentium]
MLGMNLLGKKTRVSTEPESTTMEVYFSGPSVDEHSMSVRDLAPALVGLADAIDRYKELSCPFLNLDVRITATEAGSFDVFLQILGTVVSLGQGTEPADVVHLASGVMDVLRILIARFEQTGTVKPGENEVVEQNETTVGLRIGKLSFDVNRKSYRASRDGKMINDLGAATKPASEDGYNPVRFIHKDSGNEETVSGDISESMSDLTLSDQPMEPAIETVALQIDTIQFQSRKWKFTRGDEKFWCEIDDDEFLAKLNRHDVSFCSGDLLKVELESEQYIQDGRLRMGKRRITKVIELVPIESQPSLGI